MPTGKHRRRAPEKKKHATRAGFNLKQLHKQIDELKKQLERHASNKENREARSELMDRAVHASSKAELSKTREQVLRVVSKTAQKPEGKRERARRLMLARIAEARNERANRSVEADQLRKGSKE
jgi:hypothetical protein